MGGFILFILLSGRKDLGNKRKKKVKILMPPLQPPNGDDAV
jgi:hypothetical protein